MLCEQGVLKNFAIFHKKTPLLKALFWTLFPTQVFSCEYCEVFKNTHFEEHLRTSASDSNTVVIKRGIYLGPCHSWWSFLQKQLMGFRLVCFRKKCIVNTWQDLEYTPCNCLNSTEGSVKITSSTWKDK